MSGIPLLMTFVLILVLMVIAISKWNIHPFLSLMGGSLLLAFAAGIDLSRIPSLIGSSFSNTFTSIGLVIILGALIGTILEKTGAALRMADCVVRLVGEKHPETALLLMGWIVSIPVFCDSGFVILNPIRSSLVRRTGKSSVACTVALSMGLYIAHCFIPPTPGPIAAANALYQGIGLEADLLSVMGIGVLCSILPVTAAYFYALFIGKRVKAADETADSVSASASYEELVASYGRLPGVFLSFAPILLPIVLMGLSSAFGAAGSAPKIIVFFGTPVMALTVGFLVSLVLLVRSGEGKDLYALTDETLKTVGPILFVTAAGSVLGSVISSSALISFIEDKAPLLSSLGFVFPFLLSAFLKSAQGSSTVAITATSSIVAPLMGSLGFTTPVDAALLVVAIGAGAMTVSHANDSYFWVVTNFGKLTVKDGYRTQTAGTFVVGVSALVSVLVLSLFL